ncbi:MAG: DNA polymerase Y family protein, partial [Chitinophagaceae bacterium]
MARYASISFPYLLTDHAVRRNKDLLRKAFVLSTPERGRMVVVASSPEAVKKGICTGMVVADCKAVLPDLTVIEATPGQNEKILQSLAEWCIRFTPCVSLDMPDGLVLDTTGCSHLWGGEEPYIKNIIAKLAALGYESKITIADTISA